MYQLNKDFTFVKAYYPDITNDVFVLVEIAKDCKAYLRDGEEPFIEGIGDIKPKQEFVFAYDKEDNFFIIDNWDAYPEASTAFDFTNIPTTLN